jgi:hypothetical protein
MGRGIKNSPHYRVRNFLPLSCDFSQNPNMLLTTSSDSEHLFILVRIPTHNPTPQET